MSPADSRYPVTAFDPGASEVLTVGGTRRPRATAFRARSPAPTITVGLEVFVQDVMAAIATDPELIRTVSSPIVISTDAYSRRSSAADSLSVGAGGASDSTASEAAKAGGSDAGNDSADASWTTSPSVDAT